MAENTEVQVQAPEVEPKLFSRWSYKEITISDPCFIDYVAIHTAKAMVFTPHTAGRYQQKSFRKATCPIVERLVGSMQFAGRNTGKKAKAIRIVRHAFEIIHLLTGENPIEVFIRAVIHSGPREDSTKIGSGSGRKQAVDVSPLRRVNLGIYLITHGAREHSFKVTKTIAECLADEIINAASNNAQTSYAVRKREEVEKIAKGNR